MATYRITIKYTKNMILKFIHISVNHDLIGVTKDENSFQFFFQLVDTVGKHVQNQHTLSGLSEGKSRFLSINNE